MTPSHPLLAESSSNGRGKEAPAHGAGPPLFLPFRTLAELPPEPDWLWRGFLAPGHLTMLVGDPFAGKSMLIAGLLAAMGRGQPFLGRETSQTTAVILTEEDDRMLRERADRFALLELENDRLSRSGGVFRFGWPELVERATERAVERGHGLLIVDTFPGLANLRFEEENDAGAITVRMRPLQQAAGAGLAVLFVHHTNKSGAPRGSQAFRGVTDISVLLRRQRHTNTVTLTTESRFATADSAKLSGRLVMAPDGWFYAKGTPGSTSNAGVIQSPQGTLTTDELLWDAVIAASEHGLTYGDLNDLPGLSEDKGKKRFPAWLSKGRVTRAGAGTKNDPYRWTAVVTREATHLATVTNVTA